MGQDVYSQVWDFYFGTHPKSQWQWDVQQAIAGLPVVGGIYNDYMVGKSNNERNAATRRLYGMSDTSPQYPWLSDITSTNPNVRGLSQLGMATTVPAIMGLYASEKKKYRPKKKATWHDYGYE